jgi:WD repeat-containing protein 48
MLRIKKSCAYVAEKLELAHTSSSRNHSIAGSRRPSVDPTSPLHRASSGLSMTALANAANAAAAKRRGEASSPPSAASSVRSMSHLPDAVDLIEILCNDIVLPLNTTLAEVQRFYWRSSGDPELRYRSRIISA